MSTPPPQGENPYAQQPTPPHGPPQGGNPYGQQTPPGPYGQPGQQGVPQQPSPYFNQGGGPVPPAPVAPPRRGAMKFVKIGIAVVVVGLIAFGWFASRHDANTAKVGDCMSIGNPDSTTNPDLKVVDCSDAKAKYKVAEKKDGTSGECDRSKYSQYTESGDKDFTLCLSDYKK
ncbi:hypothetical protein OG204_19145 [Streptomyces sp. NBC_01387]|uniref:LppU/SCO3897 family protein n=1 Tax=unclassified Streptomyces TaxID=2593676 RepID=UPI00202555DD|nr:MULTISPECIES: hypothetical protein [unclassified Streptomyces]MCX4549540.1 hypothetical protein [Streptomyces sp. NBC_01500]WSC21077.1 hypothetical protein OIE60_16075 [Streptomyces sp. NBC_01766]WSV55081.1 hypothetical protein OG282_16010 [Streptomyces sp. NBC_01014]